MTTGTAKIVKTEEPDPWGDLNQEDW